MTDTTVSISASDALSIRVYHTRNCANYPDRTREITKEQAQRRDLRECKHCSGDIPRATTQSRSLRAILND